jgi:hypothetical protein
VGEQVASVSGVVLTLESRVAALAEAGRAVVSLLLHESEPASGGTWEQKGLNVVHLGPHLAKTDGAVAPTSEDHLAAIERALRSKPHVVVLEEACSVGGAAWAQTFRNLLQSEGLQGFRGALVVCAREETFAVQRVCEERWSLAAESAMQQQAITGKQFEILEDVMTAYQAARSAEAEGNSKKRGGKGGRRSADDRQSAAKADELTALVEEARTLSEYCQEHTSRAAMVGFSL